MGAEFSHVVFLGVKIDPRETFEKRTVREYSPCEHFDDKDEVKKVVEGGTTIFCHQCGHELREEVTLYVLKEKHKGLFKVWGEGFEEEPTADFLMMDELYGRSDLDYLCVDGSIIVGHEMHSSHVTNIDLFKLDHDSDVVDGLIEKLSEVGLRFSAARYYSLAEIWW